MIDFAEDPLLCIPQLFNQTLHEERFQEEECDLGHAQTEHSK